MTNDEWIGAADWAGSSLGFERQAWARVETPCVVSYGAGREWEKGFSAGGTYYAGC